MAPKPKTDREAEKNNQVDRFAETARKLGADEDEAAFKEKLGVIARQMRRPARKPDETWAEIALAEAEYVRADGAQDNYVGNNPGKLTRLQKGGRSAKARVEALEAEDQSVR